MLKIECMQNDSSYHAVADEKMKKILVVANMSGFLWKFELNNALILQKMGVEVHFASNIHEKGYDFDLWQLEKLGVIFHHIEIARSPYMLKMNYKALSQLIRIIDKEGISVIHCHTPVGGLLGRLAGVFSKSNVKVIYTAHGFHFYKGAPIFNNTVFKLTERVLARVTDVIIVINQEDYKAAQAMHLKSGGKVYYVPGVGIDRTFFNPPSIGDRKEARCKLGIQDNTFFILSVGELNLNKNHKTVIAAIKQIVDDRIPVIYGICGDGYFREDIQGYAKELLGNDNRVKFFGYQRDVRDYYRAADISVFPSFREGLGMAAIESLAMGIPVVAADNRGTREYMIDGMNGYVVQADDIEGFAESIKRLYNQSLSEKEVMKKACVKSVGKYDMTKVATDMKQIFEEWI